MYKYLLSALILFSAFKPAEDSAPVSLRKLENRSFVRGEKLSYSVNYGFIKAGEVNMQIKPEPVVLKNKRCFHVYAEGKTTGATNWFFPVKDVYQTFIDEESILPMKFLRDVKEGKYRKTENVDFDHYKNLAVNNGKDTVKMVKYFQDILSAYYYSRCLNTATLKPGDIIPINAYIDADVTPFNLKFIGREEVKTDAGKFSCLVFRPQLQEGRVFADKEGMSVWITDDANHIPVMVEAKLMVGSVKMMLTDFSGLANPMLSKR